MTRFAGKRFVDADPKSPSFSPLGTQLQQQYKSPYATRFPTLVPVPKSVPLERPFERLITLRRLIRKSSRAKVLRYDAWVLVGDRNGSASFAHSQASQAYKAVQAATRRAKNSMRHYDLFEGRTLYHDITVDYQNQRIRLFAKPPGYSIKSQRNIEDFCAAVGIQDLAAQVLVGSTNPITMVRAMFYALENLHKTPEMVAEVRGKKVTDVRMLHTGSRN